MFGTMVGWHYVIKELENEYFFRQTRGSPLIPGCSGFIGGDSVGCGVLERLKLGGPVVGPLFLRLKFGDQ